MIKKYIYIIFGLICVGLGFVGALLPGLPTTPFILLAAWFFSRSSEKFESWLLNHKIFGPLILNWKKHKAISKKTKLHAIITIFCTFSITVLVAFTIFIDIIMIVFALLLSIFIYTRKGPPGE